MIYYLSFYLRSERIVFDQFSIRWSEDARRKAINIFYSGIWYMVWDRSSASDRALVYWCAYYILYKLLQNDNEHLLYTLYICKISTEFQKKWTRLRFQMLIRTHLMCAVVVVWRVYRKRVFWWLIACVAKIHAMN